MYGFLYRYFRVMRQMLIVFGFVILFTVFMPIFQALVWEAEELNNVMEHDMSCMLTYCVLMMLSYFMNDELHKADEKRLPVYFAVASPAGVKGYVKSKYIRTLLLPFIAMNVCLMTDLTAAAILDLRQDVNRATTFTGIYTGLFMMFILLSAIELPFMIRFGVKKGANVKAVIFLGILAAAGIYFLFGDISMFGTMEDFIRFLLDVMSGKRGGTTMLAISALMPIVTLALYYLSYLLSCKLYLKGVEQLEQ
ncbi:MAG: ABC-2 transporter permease [Oscillospiraceae bacterium]|nr:ABC-2 transporter permease [Oscillospiraceae bacterium]